jgi:hypothetical protein
MKHIKLFEAFSDDLSNIHLDLRRAEQKLKTEYRDKEKQLGDKYKSAVEACIQDLLEDYDAKFIYDMFPHTGQKIGFEVSVFFDKPTGSQLETLLPIIARTDKKLTAEGFIVSYVCEHNLGNFSNDDYSKDLAELSKNFIHYSGCVSLKVSMRIN